MSPAVVDLLVKVLLLLGSVIVSVAFGLSAWALKTVIQLGTRLAAHEAVDEARHDEIDRRLLEFQTQQKTATKEQRETNGQIFKKLEAIHVNGAEIRGELKAVTTRLDKLAL